MKKKATIFTVLLFLGTIIAPTINAEGHDDGSGSRDETTIGSYIYDPLGNLIKSTNSTGHTTYHLYNGIDVTEDLDSNGNVLREYIGGFDGKLAMVDYTNLGDQPENTAEILYYIHDNLGSIVILNDESSNVVERYCYEPYGETFITEPNGQTLRDESHYGNPYMWTGKRYNNETGLYHFKYRTYDPEFGRWLQCDPLGYVDSMNLYEYVQSNPVGATDSLGLQSSVSDIVNNYYDNHDQLIQMGWSPNGEHQILHEMTTIFLELGKATTDIATMFFPGADTARDISEASSGKDMINGKQLTDLERGVTVVAMVLPIIPGKPLRNTVNFIVDKAKFIGNKVKLGYNKIGGLFSFSRRSSKDELIDLPHKRFPSPPHFLPGKIYDINGADLMLEIAYSQGGRRIGYLDLTAVDPDLIEVTIDQAEYWVHHHLRDISVDVQFDHLEHMTPTIQIKNLENLPRHLRDSVEKICRNKGYIFSSDEVFKDLGW